MCEFYILIRLSLHSICIFIVSRMCNFWDFEFPQCTDRSKKPEDKECSESTISVMSSPQAFWTNEDNLGLYGVYNYKPNANGNTPTITTPLLSKFF